MGCSSLEPLGKIGPGLGDKCNGELGKSPSPPCPPDCGVLALQRMQHYSRVFLSESRVNGQLTARNLLTNHKGPVCSGPSSLNAK